MNGRNFGTSGCERGLVDFPFSRTALFAHCFQESWFFSVIFCPPGLMCNSRRRRGLGSEWNRLPQGGSQAWSLGTPVLRYPRALTPGGSCRHPLSPSSFPPSCMGSPVLARAYLGQGRWGRAPQPYNQPLSPQPCLCPLSLRCLCSSVCVTHLLFCLKLPTSFIIGSSLSSQVSPLHGSTNCPLPRPPLSSLSLCVTPIYFKS